MESPNNPSKVFEIKLPITWLITISLPILWTAIQLYFSVGVLKETVVELKGTVITLTKLATDIQKETTFLSYRIESLEEEVKQLKGTKND